MKSYQVIRTHISTYQGLDFTSTEKKLLETISGISYRALDQWDKESDTILVTNTHTQLIDLPPEVLKNTKLIIHPNSGYDHFDAERELWQNIPLVVGHEIRAQAVAEYTLACLFQAVSDLPQHIAWDKDRNWDRKLLQEKSIWVFGYGHIGKKVADTLRALGCKLTLVDPFVEASYLKKWTEGNLREADVILVCCSLNSTSKEMFNEEFFSHVSPEVLFINGARGKLVHEEALRKFLLKNPEAFCFLDVFEKEPFSHEWHSFPQVWKTSHIAGVFKNLDQKILDFEKTVLGDFLELKKEDFHLKYKNELIQNKLRQGVLI